MSDRASTEDSAENPFIYIWLDGNFYVAGEKLTGEILLNLPSARGPGRIHIKTLGIETVTITKASGDVSSAESEVFHMSTTLVDWEEFTPPGQYVFPFSFKLPHYAPATFHLNTINFDNNKIEAKITYTIHADLETEQSPISDSRIITIHNRNTRVSRQYSVNVSHPLVSCFCFNRGASSLNLSYLGPENSQIGKTSNFKLIIDNRATQARIVSIVGQVLFELSVQVPGDKTYVFTSLVSRFSPRLDGGNPNELLFDSDLSKIPFGINPSSNESSLIQAQYKVQVFVLYDVGCRTKRSEITLGIHVNPKVAEEREIKLPSDWNPKENSTSNLILQSSSGVPISSPKSATLPKSPKKMDFNSIRTFNNDTK